MVVHGMEGLDEISLSGPTLVGELKDGKISEYTINPQDFGLKAHDGAALKVTGVEQSKAMVLAALANEPGPARDIVALNAGAAIYVAGLAPTMAGGVQRALAVIASGAARKKLDAFVGFTQAAKDR
jgi:anthranilate phosphoribosyltransferase